LRIGLVGIGSGAERQSHRFSQGAEFGAIQRQDRMRIAISVIALAFTASTWWAVAVEAECTVPPPPCEELRRADLVFHGRVSKVEFLSEKSTDGSRVAFEVLRAFKGVDGKTFTGTFNITGAEEFYFAAGMEVVVYAWRYQGIWTTACSRMVMPMPTSNKRRRVIDVELEQLAACRPKPSERR
jgi:hypothetical protein